MRGRMVEMLVGHSTFCGLAQQAVLSVFDDVYKFIQVAGEHAYLCGRLSASRCKPLPA